ncbi:hypothetical protein A5877_000597 [Enterococcus sp. 3C7_DIV0644]|nr:hypothetical protein A5877_000597 [Enterococcus sp. 3C7_DIV0644]
MYTNYSVLMSVYSKESPLFLKQSIESVSYTHLDVYKRQILFGVGSGNNSKEITKYTQTVSYTHLDVYKRQV